MKQLKVLIVANNAPWGTWNEKIAALRSWFSPKVDLLVDIRHTNYAVVPFTRVTPGGNGQEPHANPLGVEPKWYDLNVSSLAIGYDIVLFVVPVSQWPLTNTARGWRFDRNLGPVELQIGADEHEKIFFPDSRQEYTFFEHGRHEILHALYMITGQLDNTHIWRDRGYNYQAALDEITFTAPREDEQISKLQMILTLATRVHALLLELKKQRDAGLAVISGKPEAPKKDLLTAWASAIQEHEGFFIPGANPLYPNGSLSYRNNNPGNVKYIGQYGSIGENKGFAVFPSYQVGFDHLKTILRNAATGKSRVYRPTMTLYEFFSTYAPAADNNDPKRYAEFVARRLGVEPTVTINSLV